MKLELAVRLVLLALMLVASDVGIAMLALLKLLDLALDTMLEFETAVVIDGVDVDTTPLLFPTHSLAVVETDDVLVVVGGNFQLSGRYE
jgi:hypothetical protein